MHGTTLPLVDNPTLGPTTFPKRHLFLDTDNLTEWGPGIYQRFPQAELEPTTGLECGPHEAWNARAASVWGNVLHEDGCFRYWGCSMPGIGSLDENCDIWLSSYAESEDGIHWVKPDLGLAAQQRWPGNNILKLPGCVMSVRRPLPAMGCRYLAMTIQVDKPYPGVCDDGSVAYHGPGDYLFGSDDGLHWFQLTKNPIIQHGDWGCLHVDPLRERYLLYNKVASIHALAARRSMVVVESRDGFHWKGYHGYRQWHESFFCDDYDDLLSVQQGGKIAEFYNHALHQVESLYIAVQTLFCVTLPLHHKVHQNPAGQSHLRLAFSHDGITWRHPRGRPVFLDAQAPGEFGCGFLTTTTNLLDVGDETWVYTQGSLLDHGRGITPDFMLDPTIPIEAHERMVRIFVAKIKRDRYASLASTYRDTFDVEIGQRQGTALTINAVTRGRGTVRIAFAEQAQPLHLEPRKGDSLPGFSFDDCIPFQGDAVWAPVRFKNKTVAEIPHGMPLVLRFEVDGAEVFGYEWHHAEDDTKA